MALLETMREILKIAREVGNTELIAKFAELQADLHEMAEENRSLQDRIRELESSSEESQPPLVEKNVYWTEDEDGKDGPFCPQCYDRESRLKRMLVDEKEDIMACPHCQLMLDIDGNLVTGQKATDFSLGLSNLRQ